MSYKIKILIENPGVVVLRDLKNGLELDLFKIQFGDDVPLQSLLRHGESIFVCFSCDQMEFCHYKSLCQHLEQSLHREKEHDFIRKMHSEEMKVKSEIASKSLVKSFHQLLQDKPFYGIQYMLEFIPGDYDNLDLPIYVCTLPSCDAWRGFARELPSHFENPGHILGYLLINNVKQLDMEVAKDLYDFDTDCSSKPWEFLKTIVDTVSYHQIYQGIYPFAVCKHIVSKVMVDKKDNSLPKSYESFSRSRSTNITTVSSRKTFSPSELSIKGRQDLQYQEVLQFKDQQDSQHQKIPQFEDQEGIQSKEAPKDLEDEYFSYFTKEVKALILDEQEINHYDSFDIDQVAKDMAEEERLRHQR